MTINYVNNEMLWLQNTLQLFSQMLVVEDLSQIRISITQLWAIYLILYLKFLHNKILRGGIATCYETWFYEYT